jgi:integrase/recombinase XerD
MGAREGQARMLSDTEHEEFMRFLRQKAHAERNLAVYLLTARSGLRIGSVAGLRLSDVLDSKGKLKQVVILRKSITKGSKTITAYFNHPEVVQALEEYLSVRPKCKSDALFITQKRTEFSANSLAHTVNALYIEAGYEGASSHSGRRFYASHLCKKGIDVFALSKLMGHSSLETTRMYVVHNQDELMSMVAST